jgi:hypothetical protein
MMRDIGGVEMPAYFGKLAESPQAMATAGKDGATAPVASAPAANAPLPAPRPPVGPGPKS